MNGPRGGFSEDYEGRRDGLRDASVHVRCFHAASEDPGASRVRIRRAGAAFSAKQRGLRGMISWVALLFLLGIGAAEVSTNPLHQPARPRRSAHGVGSAKLFALCFGGFFFVFLFRFSPHMLHRPKE